MICIGPISSIFDITSFLIMYYVMKWDTVDGSKEKLFQTGWFLMSLLTQTAVVYVLRTEKIPFIQSLPSAGVNASTAMSLIVGLTLCLISGLEDAHFSSLATAANAWWILYSILIVGGYMLTAQLGKVIYKRVWHEWL